MSEAAPPVPAPLSAPQLALFMRRARLAAHHCLYFLYHLRSSGDPSLDRLLGEDRRTALEHVRALVVGVHLPRSLADTARADADQERPLKAAPGFPTHGLRAALREQRTPPGVTIEAAAGVWAHQIWRPLRQPPTDLTAADVDGLVGRFQRFLTLSRPFSQRTGPDRLRTTLRRAAVRNLALLLGLAITLVVYTQVGVLRNLVFNMPLRAVAFPFAWVVGCTAALGLANLHARFALGKSAFWRVAYQALPPEGHLDVVDTLDEVGGVILRAEALKMLALLGLLVVGDLAVGGMTAAGVFDRTQKTLIIINSVFAVGLVCLHWIDHWDFLDHRPIRMIGLAILLGMGIAALGGHWTTIQPWLALIPGVLLVKLVRRNFRRGRRFGWVRGALAVLLVVCVGALVAAGRTRERSVWGSAHHGHVYADDQIPPRLSKDDWPAGSDDTPLVVMAASGGGSRAAVYTSYVLERLHRDLPDVAAHLQLISSVSGGSLANAAYVAMRKRDGGPFWPTEPDDLGEACAGAATGLRDGQLVRAVGQDFLLPTLRGALIPGLSRGASIEGSFDRDAHIGGVRLDDLAIAWRQHLERTHGRAEAKPPFPIPMFNSCSLDGHAVVLSPLSRAFYAADDGWPKAHDAGVAKLRRWYAVDDGPLTWVLDRDRIYGFEELNPRYVPSVAEAVRASANFPFGFPLVEVRTQVPYGTPYLRPGAREVKLTDGGVLSNSGMWTLYQLLMTPGTRERLTKRGVLLIVVDASFMPEYAANRRDLLSLYGAISDQAPIAQSLHRRMFELLQLAYGPRLRIVEVDLPASPADNVLTTWALDEESKQKLRAAFCRIWYEGGDGRAHLRDAIEARWNRLVRHADDTVEAAVIRPPLD